jgi:hypothetical protein
MAAAGLNRGGLGNLDRRHPGGYSAEASQRASEESRYEKMPAGCRRST